MRSDAKEQSLSGARRKRKRAATVEQLRYIDPNTSTAEDVSGPQWASEVKAQVDLRTVKALFHNEEWVFVSVDAIAHPISTLPLTVFRKVVKNGEETLVREDDHPVAKRLKAPNRWQTRQQLVYSYAVDYTLAGNGILYDAPISRQIIHVPCERVQYDIGANLQPKGYLFYPDLEDQILATHGAAFVPLSQVMHCRRPNPSSSFWGLSPFIPGRRSVLFNRYSTDYLLAFYLKGAAPQMILEMDEKTKEANAVRLLRSFEMAFTGRRNQRRTLLLPKGMTAKIAENKIADQNLVELIRMNRETVLNILHVPKHVVSLQEAGGLGSEEHKTALRYFWQTTITDTATALAASLTAHFMEELGEGRVIAFDFSGVSELQDDEIGKAELAEKLLATMTLNEVRKRVWKLGPIEGGDSTPGKPPALGQAPGNPEAAPSPSEDDGDEEDEDDEEEDPEEESRSTEEPAPVAKTEQDAVSGTLTPPPETEPKTPDVLQAELGQRLMAKYGEGVKATFFRRLALPFTRGISIFSSNKRMPLSARS
jgi:HK97 family phage portal protein